MDRLETLSEYQKEKIKRRLRLDFEQELIKSKRSQSRKSFSKIFRNELDILIQQFYQHGIMFYGFTIDLLYLKQNDPELWSKVHFDVEDLISEIGEKIELVEFCYISIEKHQAKRLAKRKSNIIPGRTDLVAHTNVSLSDLPHLHGIVGIRTILGENDLLDVEIKKVFRSSHGYQDIMIKKLHSIKAIKGYWNYVIKENNFRFHRFTRYSRHTNYVDIYGTIADLELIYDSEDNGSYAFEFDNCLNSNTSNITGIKIRKPNSKTLIEYLLNLFMWYKSFKISKGKIYQQIPNTAYTWRVIDNLDALKKNNVIIFECLKQIYPQQLGEVNTMEIINADWNKAMDEILDNNQYLPCIEFKKDAVEFTDGVYFINENKFLSFKEKSIELNLKMKGLNSCVYFGRSYHHLKEPKYWLNAIAKTVDSSENFCIDFARYFHSEPLEKLKKKTLLIVGSSNTGKTTLVANVIQNLFGKENVGLIGKKDNFILEQLENKDVIVFDETEYSTANRGSFLKLMNNELDLINKKGVQKYSFTNKAPVLFLFNPDQNKAMLKDDAFKNRINHYEFNHEITEYLSDIDEILKYELPQILIYCNRLYFKKKMKNNNINKNDIKYLV